MKKYDEMVFCDIVKEYYNDFLNLKNKIIDIENQINNNFIVENNELLLKIKNKLQKNIEQIIYTMTNILLWWKNYIESINALNAIFLPYNTFLLNNNYYNEARNIFENEL